MTEDRGRMKKPVHASSVLRHLSSAGRHGGNGEFRDMGIPLDQASDAAPAEAGAEAVDEMGEFLIVSTGKPGWRKPALHRLAVLRDQRGKTHYVEAEAGVAGIPDHGQPVSKQAHDTGRIAHRRTSADLDAVDFVVGAKQRD